MAPNNPIVWEMAKEALEKFYLCDHCLGRLFAQLLTKTSNEKRGKNIRYVIALYIDTLNKYRDLEGNFKKYNFRNVKIEKKQDEKRCYVCNNVFDNIDEIANKICKILEGYEYDTFLIGIIPKKEMIVHEEEVWEEIGAIYSEPLKEELSREIGKRLQQLTQKEVDFKNPDITILIDLEKNIIKKNVRSLYIYGKYNKYKEMPQTKWLCSYCHGVGCERCNYTGKKYEETVEDLIGSIILKYAKGTDTSFHGAGREDIDALCYGWRDFVIEIHEPKKRSLDLNIIEEEINNKYKGKIEVKDLKFVDRKKVVEIKEKKDNKIYEVEIESNKPFNEEDIKKIEAIRDIVLYQQTPLRVLNRRSDKIRKRKIYYVKVKEKKGSNRIILEIKSESGTYIKEFINGDEGRTRPSVSALLGKKCNVKKLIVKGFESNESNSRS